VGEPVNHRVSLIWAVGRRALSSESAESSLSLLRCGKTLIAVGLARLHGHRKNLRQRMNRGQRLDLFGVANQKVTPPALPINVCGFLSDLPAAQIDLLADLHRG
jgi:hypothetical protein